MTFAILEGMLLPFVFIAGMFLWGAWFGGKDLIEWVKRQRMGRSRESS